MEIASIGHRNCNSERMQYASVELFASSFCLFLLADIYILQVYLNK